VGSPEIQRHLAHGHVRHRSDLGIDVALVMAGAGLRDQLPECSDIGTSARPWYVLSGINSVGS
jgi:hypothetical protein